MFRLTSLRVLTFVPMVLLVAFVGLNLLLRARTRVLIDSAKHSRVTLNDTSQLIARTIDFREQLDAFGAVRRAKIEAAIPDSQTGLSRIKSAADAHRVNLTMSVLPKPDTAPADEITVSVFAEVASPTELVQFLTDIEGQLMIVHDLTITHAATVSATMTINFRSR